LTGVLDAEPFLGPSRAKFFRYGAWLKMIDYLLLAGLIMFLVSIPFYVHNRSTLEEKGFEVKEILIDSAIAIILICILLFFVG
jgi:hypothetical protein